MSIMTDADQMQEDLKHRTEKLHVEFKAWMDISKNNKEGQGKIARHIAAIANHGGGRLYFGVDDDGNVQDTSAEFGLNHYRSDAIHNLLKLRLEPPLQCEVHFTEYSNGVIYPVIHIPCHGINPIGARDEHSHMHIYVRSVGPASVKISTYQEWDTLLKRCMRLRDLEAIQVSEEHELSRTQTMTRAITDSVTASLVRMLADSLHGGTSVRAPEPDWGTVASMAEATCSDFLSQIGDLTLKSSETDNQIRKIHEQHMTAGYAMLDETGSFITLEQPQALLRAVSSQMAEIASFSWHDFIVLPGSSGPPRTRFWKIGDHEVTGVEGMRVDNRRSYSGSYDYWRAYGNSVFVICKSYREDYNRLRHADVGPFLSLTQVFVRMHSLLAHAFLNVSRTSGVAKIALFTEHAGLLDRGLLKDFDYGARYYTNLRSVDDRFRTQLVINANDLLNDYFGTLKRLCVPFLELWSGSSFSPDEWFSRKNVADIISGLQSQGCTVRIPEMRTNAP